MGPQNLNSVNQVLLRTLLALQQPIPEDELLSATLSISGTGGSQEGDVAINQGLLFLKSYAKVTIDLKGATFALDDTCGVGFMQGGTFFMCNPMLFGGVNAQNGPQTVQIPLSFFHKANQPNNNLDMTKPVTSFHMKFGKTGAYAVDVSSVKILP